MTKEKIKKLKNGNFQIDEETLREFILAKNIVNEVKKAGYYLKDIEDDLEDFVDSFIFKLNKEWN